MDRLYINITVNSEGGSIKIDMPDTKAAIKNKTNNFCWQSVTPQDLMQECKMAVMILQGREFTNDK